MAWTYQNGVRGWYDDNTQDFIAKDRLLEMRKLNPIAFAAAGTDADIQKQPGDLNVNNAGTQYNGTGMPTQGQVYKDPKTGALYSWNANARSWVPEAENGSNQYIEQFKANQNPNAQAANNLFVS